MWGPGLKKRERQRSPKKKRSVLSLLLKPRKEEVRVTAKRRTILCLVRKRKEARERKERLGLVAILAKKRRKAQAFVTKEEESQIKKKSYYYQGENRTRDSDPTPFRAIKRRGKKTRHVSLENERKKKRDRRNLPAKKGKTSQICAEEKGGENKSAALCFKEKKGPTVRSNIIISQGKRKSNHAH